MRVEERGVQDEVARDSLDALLGEPFGPLVENGVVVVVVEAAGDVRVSPADDEQRADEQAALDVPAAPEGRLELVVGAEKMQCRSGRKHLRDRGDRLRRGGVLLEDGRARVELGDRDRDARGGRRRAPRGRGEDLLEGRRMRDAALRSGACVFGCGRGGVRARARGSPLPPTGGTAPGLIASENYNRPRCDSTKHLRSSRSPFASWPRRRASGASASTAATAGGGSASAPRSTPGSSPCGATGTPAYRSEVHVQARIPVEDWTALLTGRLDGCLERESGRWLIEEFKSTNLTVDGVRPSGYSFERDRRQLLAYCYLWRRLGHPMVSGALVYVDIETGEEVSIDCLYDEETERDLERRLARLLAIWRAQEKIRERKRRAAERLPFPHTAPRPVQEKLIEAVATAVRQGENLLAEAPTGSGKTAAALHPALAEGLRQGKQVVFLTSKTLQQKMAVSALVAMNERAFSTLQVRAKEKMCANDRILCHEDFCRFAQRLPGEDGAVEHPGSPARDLPAPRSRHRLRGSAPRGGLSFRSPARARAAGRRDRGGLQLRLRAGRRAAAPRRRGAARRRS